MFQLDIYPIDPPREEFLDVEYGDTMADDRDESFSRTFTFKNGRKINFERYQDESRLPEIINLIGRELSEPYSIYTYRYFIHYWPELCILARDLDTDSIVGVVICKLEHQQMIDYHHDFGQGYIAMLAVEESYRGMGLGTRLVQSVIKVMEERECDEVVLETEVSNARSLSLYGRLGFIRESRLFRYYLNGSDAFRLKLYLERSDGPNRYNQGNTEDGDEEITKETTNSIKNHEEHLNNNDAEENISRLPKAEEENQQQSTFSAPLQSTPSSSSSTHL